jgi:hypothetical protein
MKNKLFISLLAALGLAGASAHAATFVNVSYLGGSATDTVNGRSWTKITSDQRWTRDKVYVIDRLTFVDAGVNIVIEPGTLVRCEIHTVNGDATAPSKPSDPGTLIIAVGAKIIANGTADAPIIFTSIDDPNVPGGFDTIPPYENYGTPSVGTDIEPGDGITAIVNTQRILRTGGTLTGSVTNAEYSYSGGSPGVNLKDYSGDKKHSYDGLWGGIVLCGDARISYGLFSGLPDDIAGGLKDPTSSATATANGGEGRQYVEGLQAFGTIAMYGGLDDVDNSGVMRFVSNRYGGYVLFSNRELNAFTFGAVGRGTVLEFLEAYNNADDDFEFFGGTANMKYAISAFGGDDGFDTDQGYTGNVQFLVQIQNNKSTPAGGTTGRISANVGDNGFEIDGPEPSNSDSGVVTMRPFTIQTVANATIVGRGYGTDIDSKNAGPNIKNAGALRLYNSIIMDFSGGGYSVKNGAPTSFYTGTNNGVYGDDTLQALGTATTGNEPYSLFKGNIWYRNALTEVSGQTAANIVSTGTWTDPEVGTGADNTGKLFGVNGRASSSSDNDASVLSVVTNVAAKNQFNVDPGLTIPLHHRLSGLDFRSTKSAAKTNGFILPNRGNFVRVDASNNPVTFVGAMRDNNWAKGWTALDTLGYFKAESVAIKPAVSVVNSGNNPKIIFGTQNGVLYSVEKSTDNALFVPIDVVQGTGGTAEITDAGTTIGTTPAFYRVLAL